MINEKIAETSLQIFIKVNNVVTEMKNYLEFTVQTFFAAFVHSSEEKLTYILSLDVENDIDLSDYLRSGVDPSFDRILETFGSIAKHCPKTVIDSVMIWRKAKSEPVDPDILKPLM